MGKMKTIDFEKIDAYIAECLEEGKNGKNHSFLKTIKPNLAKNITQPKDKPSIFNEIDNFIKSHFKDVKFTDKLREHIRESGMTNPQVYKAAGMTPDCFSKILTEKTGTTGKDKILALSIALGLGIDEALELFESAGIALSKNNKEDILYIYCLEHEFSIEQTNEVLEHYNCHLIGGVV